MSEPAPSPSPSLHLLSFILCFGFLHATQTPLGVKPRPLWKALSAPSRWVFLLQTLEKLKSAPSTEVDFQEVPPTQLQAGMCKESQGREEELCSLFLEMQT